MPGSAAAFGSKPGGSAPLGGDAGGSVLFAGGNNPGLAGDGLGGV
jgi:hypothetical protein